MMYAGQSHTETHYQQQMLLPPPPPPQEFLPPGWAKHSDDTDVWYTDANGDSHWEIPP